MSTPSKGRRASAPPPPATPPPNPTPPPDPAPTPVLTALVAGEVLDRVKWLCDREKLFHGPALSMVWKDLRKLVDAGKEVPHDA